VRLDQIQRDQVQRQREALKDSARQPPK